MTAAPESEFYSADPVSQIAINLFYGWGYNFYRVENQLRADDLLVRTKVGWLLGQARGSVEAAESLFRREKLPPPSRQAPRPDPQALADARRLEGLSAALGALAARVIAQPAPENDRMTQRRRTEADTLAGLVACDHRLAGQAELLRTLLDGRPAAWMIENAAIIDGGLAAITATLAGRQAALLN